MSEVSIVRCDDYGEDNVRNAMTEAIEAVGGLDMIKPGMRVGIKVNLVAGAKPDKAVTTHPMMVCQLVRMLKDKGAEVIVGDSPGGLYTAAYVNPIYSVSGMKAVEAAGAGLNRDFSEKQAEYPEGEVLHSFSYTGWLDSVDVIIDFCKLKTHGMMGMSGAAKNMFGAVPGVTKPEYHFRFPDYDRFASMIVDLDEYFKPVLSIVDAVVGMEGNGPTAGKPRHIGAVIASRSPHKADLVGAHILGIPKENLPILSAAIRRGLCPDSIDAMDIHGDPEKFVIPDFDNIARPSGLLFDSKSKLLGGIISKALRAHPKVYPTGCVGCGVCRDICPAKAIKIEDKKAVIDKKACISCFCCQEFCPKGAIKVKRTMIARLIAPGK